MRLVVAAVLLGAVAGFLLGGHPAVVRHRAILTAGDGFTITGQLSRTPSLTGTPASFYPGAQRYLVLTVSNPLTAAIMVNSLGFSVVTPYPANCAPSNLDRTGFTDTVSLNIPAGGSASVPLPLSMLDTSTDQDGCQGATFNFVYSGTAAFTEVYATSTAVGSSPNPSLVGQAVTYTATVTATQGANQDPVPSSPTGSVTFDDNNVVVCANVPVASTGTTASSATCTPPPYTAAGGHQIMAIYTDGTGDGNFTGSSATTSQTVNPAPTSTSLSAAPNPSTFGQPVTLTASVAAQSGPIPFGAVSFYLGTAASHDLLGTASLSAAGSAAISTTALPGGANSVYAVYDGGANDLGSASPAVTESVTYTGSCITGTINGGYTVLAGQSVCFGPGSRVNGGITVKSGGALAATGTTVNGGINASGATGLRICGSTVNGGISATGSAGFVLIGDGGDDGPAVCTANAISGGVTLTNGRGGFEVGGNSVSGGVTISGNIQAATTDEDAAEVEGNSITGGLSCATSNNPALTDHGQPNTVTGSRSGQCSAGGF